MREGVNTIVSTGSELWTSAWFLTCSILLCALVGRDALTTATVVPTISPNRHYMTFTRGDLLVILSNTGTKMDAQLYSAAKVGTATGKVPETETEERNPPHTVLSCANLASLGSRWEHICTKLPAGELAPCRNVTQPALLPQPVPKLETATRVDCMCRAADDSIEVCFGPGKGGEPVVYALG